MADIPGTVAKHAVVTDTCRANKGHAAAIHEAVERLRTEALCCFAGWPIGRGAQFHFALTVERPDAPGIGERPPTTLSDGSPVTPDHREIDPATGMQKGYVVLSAEERAKGFVRPVRRSYRHEKCGVVTTMGLALAETYARDPQFYGGTFCAACREHFPVGQDGEFVWEGTSEKVGT